MAVNEAANVYRLSSRTTGHNLRDTAKFMNGIDPKTLPSLGQAKQAMIERAEQREIERQLFRDLSSIGVLKRDPPGKEKAPQVSREPSAAALKAQAAKTAGAVPDFAGQVVEAIFSFFDTPRELTRGEILDLIEKQLRREDLDWKRLRQDEFHREVVAAQQAQKFMQEHQREYYLRQQDSDRQR